MIQSSRCDGSCLHPSTQYSPLLGCMSANIFSQSVWCFFTLFPWVCRNFSVLYNPIPLSSMFFFSSVVLQYWILYLSLYFYLISIFGVWWGSNFILLHVAVLSVSCWRHWLFPTVCFWAPCWEIISLWMWWLFLGSWCWPDGWCVRFCASTMLVFTLIVL